MVSLTLNLIREVPLLDGKTETKKLEILWRTLAHRNKWSVRRLKEELHKKTGVSSGDMSLEFHEVLLEDEWTVEDLVNIDQGDAVVMKVTTDDRTTIHVTHLYNGCGCSVSPWLLQVTGTSGGVLAAEREEENIPPVEGSFQALHVQVEKAVEAQQETGEGYDLDPGWAFTAGTSYKALVDHFDSEKDHIQARENAL